MYIRHLSAISHACCQQGQDPRRNASPFILLAGQIALTVIGMKEGHNLNEEVSCLTVDQYAPSEKERGKKEKGQKSTRREYLNKYEETQELFFDLFVLLSPPPFLLPSSSPCLTLVQHAPQALILLPLPVPLVHAVPEECRRHVPLLHGHDRPGHCKCQHNDSKDCHPAQSPNAQHPPTSVHCQHSVVPKSLFPTYCRVSV